MSNPSIQSSLFGNEAHDWTCPICGTLPTRPVVACHECGCHLLLLVKIRRLHDDYKANNKLNAAQAMYKPKSS